MKSVRSPVLKQISSRPCGKSNRKGFLCQIKGLEVGVIIFTPSGVKRRLIPVVY
jgi:hypothetical protein